MLTIQLVILSIFPLLTILLSGLGIEIIISRIFNSHSLSDIRCLRIAVFGILWTTLCFGIALLNISKKMFPNMNWSILFLCSTLVIISAAVWSEKINFREKNATNLISHIVGFSIFAILMECFSVHYFPHVFDAVQLGWTNQFTDPLSIAYGKQTGAVGYSALIFFTGLLAPNLPLLISAAAVKVVIFFLVAAVIFSVSRVFYGQQFRLGIVIVAFCILGSPFGFLAFSYGKDSILGVVLELACILLLADSKIRGQFENVALLSGVAAICGVITIPFTCIIATLALISVSGMRRKVNSLAMFFLLSVPLLAFPLSVLLHGSCIPMLISSFVLGVILILLGRSDKLDAINIPKLSFWVPVSVVLLSTLAAFRLLPVFKVLPEFYGGDHGIVQPFDGKTGFLGLLYSFNSCSGFATGVYLIAPFFALFLLRRKKPEGWIPFFYLQLTIALVLLSCHMRQSVLDASNQWDLIKDSMNYFVGPTTAMMLGPVIALIPRDQVTRKSLTPFFCIVLVGSLAESLSVYQMKTGDFYPCAQIGCFKYPRRSAEIPIVADFFYKRGGAHTLLVDQATGFPTMGPIQGFCPHITILSEPHLLAKMNVLIPNTAEPFFVITKISTASLIRAMFPRDVIISTVLNLPDKDLMMIEIAKK